MTENSIASILLLLGVFLLLAHLLGFIFEKLHQPRLVGEILSGILVGPFVLGQLFPDIFTNFFSIGQGAMNDTATVFGFLYWLGVLLLMFLAGSEVRNLLSKENRRPTAWLLAVGTPLPFFIVIGLGLADIIPLSSLIGEKGVAFSALLVLASATAVTSIPVISRIFHDLGIMKTRFASLILGSAVIEDIALWGILAVAVSYATSASIDGGVTDATVVHVALNIAYLLIAMLVMPRILSFLRKSKWNWLYQKSPVAYSVVVLALYVALASVMQTSIVFAAFLAGYGLVGGAGGRERKHFTESLSVIHKISYAVFIPLYFALVGYRLVFDGTFSITMLLVFLIGSSVLILASMSLAAWLAGFRGISVVNIAVTTNARGGPGIVLASVAFEAGLISSAFYTTLVLSALITSQVTGWWLRRVLHKKLPLLV